MQKTQMYFPISEINKHKVEYIANRLSVPASNIISEIVAQALDKPNLDIHVPTSPVHTTTNEEIEESARKFAEGYRGKKHHLVD